MPGKILLSAKEYTVADTWKQSLFSELAAPIREGQARRVDRLISDFREDSSWPLGLGYKYGPVGKVFGGIWKSELRCDWPGQIIPPLISTSQALNLGDLSAEVTNNGRISSCNTDLGNTSGKKRLYIGAGTKLARQVSDTNFSIEDSTYAVLTGVDRIYCMAEIILANIRYLGIGTEEQTTTSSNSALAVTANPTATPPVFSYVNTGGGAGEGRVKDCYWMVSIDAVRRTYAHINGNGNVGYPSGEFLVYWAYSAALTAVPTAVGVSGDLRKGDQIAGVIGSRIWLLSPFQDAQVNEDADKGLRVIDIGQSHQLTDVETRTRTVTLACRYDHPSYGPGIAYTDGKACFWTNGASHVNLGWLRYQGRDVACTIKGLSPKGEMLYVCVQNDTNTAVWWEFYKPMSNEWGGSWYSYSKRITTTVGLILPGGTVRGTTLPWAATGLNHYWIEPSATNSNIIRQKCYAYHSNPLLDSADTDTAESGALAAEFPCTDSWGGEEVQGVITTHYFGGLNGKALGVNDTVAWAYNTAPDGAYTTVATYQATDQSTTLGSGGVAQRRFGTRCTITTAAGTGYPNGAISLWRGGKEPDSRWVFEFNILFEEGDAQWQAFEADVMTNRDLAPRPLLSVGANTYYVYLADCELTREAPQGAYDRAARVKSAKVTLVEDR